MGTKPFEHDNTVEQIEDSHDYCLCTSCFTQRIAKRSRDKLTQDRRFTTLNELVIMLQIDRPVDDMVVARLRDEWK